MDVMKHQTNISAHISKFKKNDLSMINMYGENRLPPNSTSRCLGVNFSESRRRRNERSFINSGILTVVSSMINQ